MDTLPVEIIDDIYKKLIELNRKPKLRDEIHVQILLMTLNKLDTIYDQHTVNVMMIYHMLFILGKSKRIYKFRREYNLKEIIEILWDIMTSDNIIELQCMLKRF